MCNDEWSDDKIIELKQAFDETLSTFLPYYRECFFKRIPEEMRSGEHARAYGSAFALYKKLITESSIDLKQAAIADLDAYSKQFKIHFVIPDEYKLIYFFGIVIEKELIERGHADEAKTHMWAMIAMLHNCLKAAKVDEKEGLRKAMIKLIEADNFHDGLGKFGGYLIYKAVSTTIKK